MKLIINDIFETLENYSRRYSKYKFFTTFLILIFTIRRAEKNYTSIAKRNGEREESRNFEKKKKKNYSIYIYTPFHTFKLLLLLEHV